MKHVRSADFKTVYTNFAQAAFTPWDMRIIFSLVGEHEIDNVGIIEQATVVMSPALTKALVNLLNHNIKQYESVNGEIKIPLSALPQGQQQTVPEPAPKQKPKPMLPKKQ